MRRCCWIVGVWALSGCGLPKCVELCERHADCVEATLSDNGETWQAWTGFTDREAYVEGCLGVFEDSQGDGAGRGDLQKTCKAELDDDACP